MVSFVLMVQFLSTILLGYVIVGNGMVSFVLMVKFLSTILFEYVTV